MSEDLNIQNAGHHDEAIQNAPGSHDFKDTFIRISEIPADWTSDRLTTHLQIALATSLSIRYLFKSCQSTGSPETKTAVALLSPILLPDKLQILEEPGRYNSSIPLTVDGQSLRVDKGCLGFTTLYTPAEEANIQMDIVALHGLSGHAIGAWTGDGVCWIGDFLCRSFPNARIMTYGYDARLSRDSSISRLSDYAGMFVSELLVVRGNAKSRPLFVLGQSFGGTVLAYALSILKNPQRAEDRNYQTLLAALKCMVFFGTPHRGTSVKDLMNLAVSSSKRGLVSDIDPHSEILKILLDVLGQARGIKMLTCIEQIRRENLSGEQERNTIAVEEHEARLYSSDEELIRIYADHKGMNKFSYAGDRHYTQLVYHFKNVLEANIPVTGLFYQNTAVETLNDEQFGYRTKELSRLSEIVARQVVQGGPVRVSVYGIPGVGKTQLALKHINQHRGQYQVSFSVDASDEITLGQHISVMAAQLTGGHDGPFPVALNLCRINGWLSENPDVRIVIVYDNVDAVYSKIRQFIPDSRQCQLFYTSRIRAVAVALAGGVENTIELLEWEEKDAFEFLWRKHENDESMREKHASDDGVQQAIQKISRLVGGLPIALNQAYLFTKWFGQSWQCTLSDLKEDMSKVLETLTPQDYSLSTKVLFENSFRKLGRENQSALDIFTLLAFLNPTSLSQQVFRELDDSFLLTQEKIRSHQSSSSLRVRIAKQRLLDSGLLRENTSTRQYSLHDLTHLFLRERLSQEEKDQCIHATIDFIWRNLPEARNAHVAERWETASRYVSHAVSVVEHAKDLPIKPVRLVDILIRTAGMLVEQGFTDKATELAVNAFEYSRGIQDYPHAQRSKCLSIIGYVFNYGGSNSKTAHAALPFYEDAYDIDRVQLGDDHEDTIIDLHNLGGVQRNTGDWQTAQKTFEEVIQKGRRLFMDSRDSLHPYASMISLGEILREQNKFLDSIKLLREAEEGLRKRQGDKSSWTLYCTTELGKALLDATLAGVLNARDEAQRKLDTAHKGLSEVLGDEDEYTKSALAAFGKTQDLDPPLAYQA